MWRSNLPSAENQVVGVRFGRGIESGAEIATLTLRWGFPLIAIHPQKADKCDFSQTKTNVCSDANVGLSGKVTGLNLPLLGKIHPARDDQRQYGAFVRTK